MVNGHGFFSRQSRSSRSDLLGGAFGKNGEIRMTFFGVFEPASNKKLNPRVEFFVTGAATPESE